MKIKFMLAALILPAILTLNFRLSTCLAQGTAFTYQGRLNDGTGPVTGTYDLRFSAYDSLSGGTLIAGPLIKSGTGTTNGLFTVTLDFGLGVFTGANRFLEIAARTNGAPLFAILSPRQQLTPTPYAITAENLNGVVGNAGLAGTYGNVINFSNSGNQFAGTFAGSFFGDASGLQNLNAFQLTIGVVPDARLSTNIARINQVWLIGGNAGTSSDFIGTLDDEPFDIRVNNTRAMRYRLNTDATGSYSEAPNVVGGSSDNSVSAGVIGATIAGGGGHYNLNPQRSEGNKVTEYFGTVSGGFSNTCSGFAATVSGGDNNTSSGAEATVAGGGVNTASGDQSTVGGGTMNLSSGVNATIGGGYINTSSGFNSVVAGGGYNLSSGLGSSVGGGEHNICSGDHATVPGGFVNTASADSSFAAGHQAKADNIGAFVWADSSDFDFHSVNRDQFCVRSTGGAKFVTAIDGTGAQTAGVRLLAGDNAWSSISDRNAKKNFQTINVETLLEKLVAVPVQSWNYKWEADSDTPHLGPMAQDFKAAFYPGRDDKSINTMELDGVELAAIQGLNAKLTEELKEKETEIDELKLRLARLEKAMTSSTVGH